MLKCLLALRLPRIAVLFLKEGMLDFIMNAQQPCFRTGGSIAKMCNSLFKLPGPFFRGAQLKRKLVGQMHCACAVVLGHFSRFLQQGYNGSPGIVHDDIAFHLTLWHRRERDNRRRFLACIVGQFAILFDLVCVDNF